MDRILKFIKEYPTYGPARIANGLGNIVCPVTVYNILKRRGPNRKIYRLLALKDIPASVKVRPVVARTIGEANPPPKIESHYTDYMLSVDTFYVCRLKGVDRIYQFSAIGTFS